MLGRFTLALALAVAASASSAQTASCLSRTLTNSKGKAFDLTIIVPATDVNELVADGFSSRPCAGLERRIADYQAAVCKGAALGNDAVQARLEQVIGVAPAKLCSAATALGKTAN